MNKFNFTIYFGKGITSRSDLQYLQNNVSRDFNLHDRFLCDVNQLLKYIPFTDFNNIIIDNATDELSTIVTLKDVENEGIFVLTFYNVDVDIASDVGFLVHLDFDNATSFHTTLDNCGYWLGCMLS